MTEPDRPDLHGLVAPVDVLDLELEAPPTDAPDDVLARPALVLARRHGVPVATVTVSAGTPRAALVELAAQAAVTTSPAPVPTPPRGEVVAARELRSARVAVVVTTIRASDDLLATLDDVLQQSSPPAEVVVVDNRPVSSGVRELLESRGLLTSTSDDDVPGVRYVAEQRPGLARARNAGLAAVTADLVAFTDDDVRLDHDWLARLAAAFADGGDDVACVTGLVVPRALHTDAQLLMEQFGGFAKGLAPRRYDLGRHRGEGPLYPFAVGVYGTGANAAFRTAALRALGGFDPALGTGRVTRGGEDLDVFLRVVLAGHALVYEPAAVVWHDHEDEMRAFTQRVFGYGVGLGAVLAKHLVGPADVRRAMLRRVPAGLRHLGDPASSKNAQKGDSYPRRFTWLERLGIMVGPFAYLAAATANRADRSARARGRNLDGMPIPSRTE